MEPASVLALVPVPVVARVLVPEVEAAGRERRV